MNHFRLRTHSSLDLSSHGMLSASLIQNASNGQDPSVPYLGRLPWLCKRSCSIPLAAIATLYHTFWQEWQASDPSAVITGTPHAECSVVCPLLTSLWMFTCEAGTMGTHHKFAHNRTILGDFLRLFCWHELVLPQPLEDCWFILDASQSFTFKLATQAVICITFHELRYSIISSSLSILLECTVITSRTILASEFRFAFRGRTADNIRRPTLRLL